MRRKSSNKNLDKILKMHYKESYEKAFQILLYSSREDLAILYKAKDYEAEMESKKHVNKKGKSFEESIATMLRINEANAVKDASIAILKMGSIN